MNRINILIVDKDMNTLELEVPTFMLEQLNYDNSMVKNHKTKASLQAEISEFIKNV
jgi:hypothetical protein